jgi:hypothetical protein
LKGEHTTMSSMGQAQDKDFTDYRKPTPEEKAEEKKREDAIRLWHWTWDGMKPVLPTQWCSACKESRLQTYWWPEHRGCLGWCTCQECQPEYHAAFVERAAVVAAQVYP